MTSVVVGLASLDSAIGMVQLEWWNTGMMGLKEFQTIYVVL
jgi:hypothetical protein